MTNPKYGWTLVQHSGYGYRGDPQFERAVEPRAVDSAALRDQINEAGGKLYPDYVEADQAACTEMYPDGYDGMIPVAAGRFAQLQVDQLRLYVFEVVPTT